MEVRRSIYLLLGCLIALGGCRSGQHRAMLEQELRMQEDRIYQLQDCLQETQISLEASSQENEALRRSLADRQGDTPDRRADEGPGTPRGLNVEIPSGSQLPQQGPSLLRDEAAPRDRSSGPSLEGGILRVTPGVEAPPSAHESPPEEVPPPRFPTTPGQPGGQSDPTTDATNRGEQATRIEVNDMAIERIAGPRSEGVEAGLSLLVVPRDARGEPLPAPAAVSVVVIDPAISGPAARVGRWDFTAEEMAALYESSETAEGFRLRLKWPDRGPAHKELHLFVRYETADGRKLNAEIPFDLGRLAAASPRRAGRSAGNWQRKVRTTPREQAGPRVADRSASSSEAPRWGTSAAAGRTTEAPPWSGPVANRRSHRITQSRSPQRVSARPQPPVWSPERK